MRALRPVLAFLIVGVVVAAVLIGSWLEDAGRDGSAGLSGTLPEGFTVGAVAGVRAGGANAVDIDASRWREAE